MFCIEVNLLTGRFVATSHHDRSQSEWPPHPARLFSALVATWADSDQPDPIERAALEWLECQGPPSIAASKAVPRRVVTHFVPINDAAIIGASWYRNRAMKVGELLQQFEEAIEVSHGEMTRKATSIENRMVKQLEVTDQVSRVGNTNPNEALKLLPEGRVKQAREFPSVTPLEPRLSFVWESIPTAEVRSALDGLLGRVTRLGHSSSLVACRLSNDPPPSTYIPSRQGEVFRSVRQGQLARLEHEYRQHKASRPRTLPSTAVRYRHTEATVPTEDPAHRPGTAGEWLVFEFAPQSRWLPSARAVDVARVLRAAVLDYAEDPIPEGLSGHGPDRSPSESPHVGFLPLPSVGHEYSDGRLMGIAISLPHSLDEESGRSVLRAVGTWERTVTKREGRGGRLPVLRLTMGRRGVVKMTRQTGLSALVALRPQVWRRPSRRWVSAFPIALPAHPGPLGKGTPAARAKAWAKAEAGVIASCRHVGLPEPEKVVLAFEPFILGARPAHHFPGFRQGVPGDGAVPRRLVHAVVTFAEPVEGPLVLGAGRYLGLGLMRPIGDSRSEDA